MRLIGVESLKGQISIDDEILREDTRNERLAVRPALLAAQRNAAAT